MSYVYAEHTANSIMGRTEYERCRLWHQRDAKGQKQAALASRWITVSLSATNNTFFVVAWDQQLDNIFLQTRVCTEKNGKSTEDDRNNTSCCSDKGVVCEHPEKAQAAAVAQCPVHAR